jgi:hypothetical protein
VNYDAGAHFGRDHVRAQPTIDGSDVHGDATGSVLEREEFLDLVGHFEDGAGTLFEIDARVSGVTLNGDRESIRGLAGCFEFTGAAEGQLKNKSACRAAG